MSVDLPAPGLPVMWKMPLPDLIQVTRSVLACSLFLSVVASRFRERGGRVFSGVLSLFLVPATHSSVPGVGCILSSRSNMMSNESSSRTRSSVFALLEYVSSNSSDFWISSKARASQPRESETLWTRTSTLLLAPSISFSLSLLCWISSPIDTTSDLIKTPLGMTKAGGDGAKENGKILLGYADNVQDYPALVSIQCVLH